MKNPGSLQGMQRSGWYQVGIVLVFGLALWVIVFAILLKLPPAGLTEVRGLYPAEPGRGDQRFQWSGSRVEVPLHGYGQAIFVNLAMAGEDWPGRRLPAINLATERGELGSFTVAAEVRSYHLLVPPDTTRLSLQTTLTRTPDGARLVGFQLFDLQAQLIEPAWQVAGLALLLTLAGLALLPALFLAFVRGHGPLLLILLPALLLRLYRLDDLPPGVHQDELVALVDAWYLLYSGHDHHGNLLPLGAFESFGDWASPLLTYLELPAVALLGPVAPAGRLVTALFGSLAVLLIYGLARTLALPRPAAWICALVAAVSPWQVAMSRFAIPPALVFPFLTLCLWAAVRFLARQAVRRFDGGLVLALTAGIALYAYPTMKLLIPLVVSVSMLLALRMYGWREMRRWLLPAGVLVLLWLPFGFVTVLNPLSATRFNQLAISARSPGQWLERWWQNYSLYWQPAFYYQSGDGLEQHAYLHSGVQLWIELPLLLIGLGGLLLLVVGEVGRGGYRQQAGTGAGSQWKILPGAAPGAWLLIAATVLLAPLPTSLTDNNPHAYRATTIGPLYVLLVGLGVAMLWRWFAPKHAPRWRRTLAGAGLAFYAGVLIWQGGNWYLGYTRGYPAAVAGPWRFQDGLVETMRYTAGQAATYDEIWIAREIGKEPYIYLLAGLPRPLADSQHQLTVVPGPEGFNQVVAVGRYRFVPLASMNLPANLPVRDIILNRLGQPVYLLREWQYAGLRRLIVTPFIGIT